MAARLPTVMVRTAITDSNGSQVERTETSGPMKMRIRKAMEAAFDATERYAVTVVGAPSYASGAHMWKGAAETLKSRPTAVVVSARKTTGSQAGRCAISAAISERFVERAMPYITENP